MIIYTFSTHFLRQPNQKSAFKYIVCEKYVKIYNFLEPPMPKNYDFQGKRPVNFNPDFNNQQITASVTAFRNQKS